jgi:hypothetical protein
MFFTVKFVLVPISGMGDISGGTTAGGAIVIRIMSPVLMIKSAGICHPPSSGLIGKIWHLLYQNNDANATARRACAFFGAFHVDHYRRRICSLLRDLMHDVPPPRDQIRRMTKDTPFLITRARGNAAII